MNYIVDSDLAGSYFEFGTHRARSFTMVTGLDYLSGMNMGPTASGLTPKPGSGYIYKYFLFDSFEGWSQGLQNSEHH